MTFKPLLPFLAVSFFLGRSLQAEPVYFIANPTNVGDTNQLKGIERALKAKDLQMSSTFLESPEKTQAIKEAVAEGQQVTVIGAGEGGVTGIRALEPAKNLRVYHTSHMPLAAYKDPKFLEKINGIALPTHTSLEEKAALGTKLIETVGVSHNRTSEAADATYAKHKGDLPPAKQYLGVILGGDAPDVPPSKTMKFFTTEDVLKLADHVVRTSGHDKAHVLVLNGPRTGKYDPKTQEEDMTVHRKGASDPMTALFVRQLEANHIPYTLLDFQHKSPDSPAPAYENFDLVVGALRASKGLLLVPGESTSMISEAIDVMPHNQVVVYPHGAMNAAHRAHVKSEFEAGRVWLLESRGAILRPEGGKSVEPSAARVIAERVFKEK